VYRWFTGSKKGRSYHEYHTYIQFDRCFALSGGSFYLSALIRRLYTRPLPASFHSRPIDGSRFPLGGCRFHWSLHQIDGTGDRLVFVYCAGMWLLLHFSQPATQFKQLPQIHYATEHFISYPSTVYPLPIAFFARCSQRLNTRTSRKRPLHYLFRNLLCLFRGLRKQGHAL
jgi:hypothetical protein